MEKVKVLWIDNGDENLYHIVEEAKANGIEIESCYSMQACLRKLGNNENMWDAIIISAACRVDMERPKIGNMGVVVKKLRTSYRDIPRFVVFNKEKLNYYDHTRVNDVLEEGEEYHVLLPSATPLFEAIRLRVTSNPEAKVRKKYANELNFFPEEQLLKLLFKLENEDITKETTIPNACRILLERLQKYPLFAKMYISDKIFNELEDKHKRDGDKKKFNPENYNELSLNDFSYAFGLSNNVPIHVKRSIFACTSVNQPGSHDTYINKMIEQGKARYATRALIMELLNIIEWCSQLNPNTFEL